MRLHEEVIMLRAAIRKAEADLFTFKCSIDRKVRAPYPDGTTGPEVNANTDVLPRIDAIRAELAAVILEMPGGRPRAPKVAR